MSKPKLVLINPFHFYLKNPAAQAPLGLLYIAAAVRERGFPVEYVDLSDKHLEDDFEIPEGNIYGITGTILDTAACHNIARRLKERDKGACVILGGPITLSPEYIDKWLFSSMIFGEGEQIILRVLADYPHLAAKYYATRIDDLDALSFPARDLIVGQLGGSVFARGEERYEGGSTVLTTSRGCTFGCVYCASPGIWGRKVRYRSAANVVAEIDQVIRDFGVRQFRISDDNMTADRGRLLAMCELLKGRNIAWRASIRVRPNDLEMFVAMKAAGCAEVCFGIESGDGDVLMAIKKGAGVLDNFHAIVNAKKAGLAVRILFMTGCPGETRKTTDKNIAFLESVKDQYDAIALTNFVPLPGTKVASQPGECGCEILPEGFDIENFNLCMFGPEGPNKWKNLVRPVGLTIEQLTKNKQRMREYVESTGKLNEG